MKQGSLKLPVQAILLLGTLIPVQAFAAQTQSRTVRLSEDTSRPSGFGLNLFVGGDGAFVKTSSSDADESSKQGTLYGGKALLTLVNRDLEIEGGAGYSISLLQGDGDIVDGDTPNSKIQLQNVRIETRTALAEFSARLRMNEEIDGDAVWSLGPAAAAYLGTNASFGPDTKKAYRSAFFLGGQLALQFGSEFKPRLVLSYLTDVNLFERQVHIGMLSLQLGMSIFTPKTIIKDVRNQTNDEIIKKIQVEKTIEKTIVKENVRFLLDSEMVNFETDKAILLKRSDVFLRELGVVLAQHPERWSSLVVEGHTDIRGSLDHNNRLSLARANSVRDALARAGVPAARMRAVGFGPSRPLDPAQSEVAWARNRRVELSFEGVKDQRWLRDVLQKLKNALGSTRR
ncbi:MAG: OmpA family protein [Silvanigrellaceae bacterium]